MKKLTPLLLVICLVPSVYAKPKCKKSKPTCGATSISSDDCPKEGCHRLAGGGGLGMIESLGSQ